MNRTALLIIDAAGNVPLPSFVVEIPDCSHCPFNIIGFCANPACPTIFETDITTIPRRCPLPVGPDMPKEL